MTTTDLRAALFAATGGPAGSPDSRLDWLRALLIDLRESGWADGTIDPAATREAIAESQALLADLDTLVSSLEPGEEPVAAVVMPPDDPEVPF